MILHWLHGERTFNKEIKKETKCKPCIHFKVCDSRPERRCINYRFGDSREKHCQSCSHKYTRYDTRQPIPCFHCEDFKPDYLTKFDHRKIPITDAEGKE